MNLFSNTASFLSGEFEQAMNSVVISVPNWKWLLLIFGLSFLFLIRGLVAGVLKSLKQSQKYFFEKNAFFAQFFAALTPLPDRVFSFLAGAFVISPIIIFIATFLGRLLRVSIVAFIAHRYGDEARSFIKKHTKLATVGVLTLISLYILYTFLH